MRPVLPEPPVTSSVSWWLGLGPAEFYDACRARYPQISAGKFGRMEVHTWVGNAPPPVTHRQNQRHQPV